MDILQIIIGRFLLEFLGALLRYVYFNILGLFKNVNYIPFSQLWSPKVSVKKRDENSELNHMIGVIIFGLIIFLLVIFMIYN